jgi:hypothetical protein
LLGSQGVGLLLQQDGEGAFGQASGGDAGNVLHSLEIDLRARACVAEGVAGNDFAPLGGAVMDGLEVLG